MTDNLARGDKARESIWSFTFLLNCLLLVVGLNLFMSCKNGCNNLLVQEPARSIILITIDTLRADHLSGYGYRLPTSPNIDSFMAKGVRFERAFSPSSSTAPSHASILTGLYPGFHSVGAYNALYKLSNNTDTLAELLKNFGYTTAAIVSNPVLVKELNLNQGFQTYDDHLEGKEMNRSIPERYADVAIDKALAQLKAFDTSPFFFWLHLNDPHGPYNPPNKWMKFKKTDYPLNDMTLEIGQDESGYQAIPAYQAFHQHREYVDYVLRYDCEIAFADYELGRLFSYLEESRMFDNTLVIITADHGEAMGEDGFYFAHSHSVGLDQVLVPLIMVGPGISGGTVISEEVSLTAIFDTVLEFASPHKTSAFWPRSLLPLACGQKKPFPLLPSFTENLNQVGIAYEGAFIRRDRRTSNDVDFWASPNPNTGGFWKPLGIERRNFLPDEQNNNQKFHGLENLLNAFQKESDSRTASIKNREKMIYSEEQLNNIRSLGYVN